MNTRSVVCKGVSAETVKALCEQQWERKGVRHNIKRCAWQICVGMPVGDEPGGPYIVIHHFTAMRFPYKRHRWSVKTDDRYTPSCLRWYRIAHAEMCREARERLA